MPTNLRNILQTLFTRLSTGSAFTKTEASWAERIESWAAAPAVYKDFFEPLRAEGRAFPYTLLTPSYEGFMHRATEKLVCDLGCEIHVLEKDGEAFEAQCYPLEGISYVETRTMLLASSITICGLTRQGLPAVSTVEFNSVSDHLFTPLVELMRLPAAASGEAVRRSELEKFDGWASLNFKFMNYAKSSLLPGEKVVCAVLQPEIRASVWKFLGKTHYRTRFPAHASILTDHEFITIRDDENPGGEGKHGGIWDYIPLSKIVALSLTPKENDLLVLSVGLPENVRLEYVFQASARREVDQLLERLLELTGV
ncbi:MAG: hypothetical protein WA821_19805 [Anaerolineales bacterium]